MEQTERLSVQSRNYNIYCFYCHLVCTEFRFRRHGRRPLQELRRIHRPVSCPRSRTCRPRHVADRSSAYIRHLSKRGRRFQLCRFIWRNQCQFPCGNADYCTKHTKRQSWLRAAECFQPYDILSALRSLHSYRSYYKKRKRIMEIYLRNDRLPAIVCMGGFRPHISGGQFIFINTLISCAICVRIMNSAMINY